MNHLLNDVVIVVISLSIPIIITILTILSGKE
jgi:hypothetical protein